MTIKAIQCTLCAFQMPFLPVQKSHEIVLVIHVLTQHPDVFRELSGQDPEARLAEYQEQLGDDWQELYDMASLSVEESIALCDLTEYFLENPEFINAIREPNPQRNEP